MNAGQAAYTFRRNLTRGFEYGKLSPCGGQILSPFYCCTQIRRCRTPIPLSKWTIVSSFFGDRSPAAGRAGQLRGGLPVPAAVFSGLVSRTGPCGVRRRVLPVGGGVLPCGAPPRPQRELAVAGHSGGSVPGRLPVPHRADLHRLPARRSRRGRLLGFGPHRNAGGGHHRPAAAAGSRQRLRGAALRPVFPASAHLAGRNRAASPPPGRPAPCGAGSAHAGRHAAHLGHGHSATQPGRCRVCPAHPGPDRLGRPPSAPAGRLHSGAARAQPAGGGLAVRPCGRGLAAHRAARQRAGRAHRGGSSARGPLPRRGRRAGGHLPAVPAVFCGAGRVSVRGLYRPAARRAHRRQLCPARVL